MKIGDKVRVIGNSNKTNGGRYHNFFIGDEVTIIRQDDTDLSLFGCRSDVLNFQWVYDWDLVPVEKGFDTNLKEELEHNSVYFGKPVKKEKERKPDGIDWEAHRAYLKSLR